MIDSFKDRLKHYGQLLEGATIVKVYRNLGNHTPRKWSIVDPKEGLVIGHADIVHLKNVKFVVQAGYARVRAEGRKNVHAYAVGHLQLKLMERQGRGDPIYLGIGRRLTYNPRRADFFHDARFCGADDLRKGRVQSEDRVVLCDTGRVYQTYPIKAAIDSGANFHAQLRTLAKT